MFTMPMTTVTVTTSMTTTNKLLIPIIRKVFPQTLAKQIASVQPMTAPAGSIFNMVSPTPANVTYHEWMSSSQYMRVAARLLIIHNERDSWDSGHPREVYEKMITSYAVFLYARDTRTFMCYKDRAGLSCPSIYLEELKIPVSLTKNCSGVHDHLYELDDTPAGMLAAMKYGL